jgi:hypothetical protein
MPEEMVGDMEESFGQYYEAQSSGVGYGGAQLGG